MSKSCETFAFLITLSLSCQPRVTMTSCSVYKVIRDLQSIDHLCTNPILQDRINTQVIYQFALAQVECNVRGPKVVTLTHLGDCPG